MTEKKAIAHEEKRMKDDAALEKAVAKAKRATVLADSGQVVRYHRARHRHYYADHTSFER